MPPSRRSSPPTKTDRAGSARGNIAPLVAVFVALTASCCAAVARVGLHVVNRARAQAAADSVALAYVMQGDSVARRVASVQSARIVSVVDDGSTASVVVTVSGKQRSATAVRALRYGDTTDG